MDVDVEAYLSSKGWAFKPAGTQFNLDCPMCNGTKKFYINKASGLWDCKACLEKGNFWGLKKIQRDLPTFHEAGVYIPPPKPMPPVNQKELPSPTQMDEALDWMTSVRKLPVASINAFHVGCLQRNGQTYVTLPYMNAKHVEVLRKMRNISDKSDMWREPSGAQSPLFGEHLLTQNYPFAVLVEGEFDAIAGHAYGIPNILSVPNGASGFQKSWLKTLEPYDVVVLGFDSDKQGEQGVQKLAKQLGWLRCRIVKWPLKDLNDCLKAGIPTEQILKCIEDATHTSPIQFRSLADGIRARIETPTASTGWRSDYEDLNDLLGGMRPGEVTVLAGNTSSGKSTFALNLAVQAAKRGEATLILSTELGPDPVIDKLSAMIGGQDLVTMDKAQQESLLAQAEKMICIVADLHGSVPEAQLEDIVTYACGKFGVTFIVMDHLHYLVPRVAATDERHSIESYVRTVSSLKLKTKAHIVLVSHIRNWKAGEKLSMELLKGASGIKQEADNILLVQRDTDGELTGKGNRVKFILDKNRVKGTIGEFNLEFSPTSQTYARMMRDGLPRAYEA